MPVKFWHAGQASSGTMTTIYFMREFAFIRSSDWAAGELSHVSSDRSVNLKVGFVDDGTGLGFDTRLTPGHQISLILT